jgi:plastocyanin
MQHSLRSWSHRVFCRVALVVGIAAPCGCAGWQSSTRSQPVVEIVAGEGAFTPPHVTVYEGTTIRWMNTSAGAHSVTSGGELAGAAFDSRLASGASFELTFHVAGSQRYFCRDHEAAGMAGVVTVVPAPPPIGDNATGSDY